MEEKNKKAYAVIMASAFGHTACACDIKAVFRSREAAEEYIRKIDEAKDDRKRDIIPSDTLQSLTDEFTRQVTERIYGEYWDEGCDFSARYGSILRKEILRIDPTMEDALSGLSDDDLSILDVTYAISIASEHRFTERATEVIREAVNNLEELHERFCEEVDDLHLMTWLTNEAGYDEETVRLSMDIRDAEQYDIPVSYSITEVPYYDE